MHKRLMGVLAIVAALLSGCSQGVSGTPVVPPKVSTPIGAQIAPAPLDAPIPGTTYEQAFGRHCAPDVKSVIFSEYEVTRRNGIAERAVDGGTIVFELIGGSLSGSDVPDIASVALIGNPTPVAVIVNSKLGAALTGKPPITFVLPGETFAPYLNEKKFHTIQVCYS